MKNVTLIATHRPRTYQLLIGLLIFIISIVSIDALHAQTDRPTEKKKLRIDGMSFKHSERSDDGSRMACDRLPNRTLDGTCNNISSDNTANWGAADIPINRAMTAAYGGPDFFNNMAGQCRPSARAVSNIVVAQSADSPSPRGLSSLVFTWGQFIDHDIDLSPEDHTEYEPVLLPFDEPLFTDDIPFFRSAPYPDTGVDNPREQQNIITSWLDGSQVYGSDDERAKWLRSGERGNLKISVGDLMPYNTVSGELDAAIDPEAPSMAGDEFGTVKVFVAGDVRANEQPGLTAMHTLFVREHNRICDRLVQNGSTNDEQNYQQARKIIGGMIQQITFEDFLPALGIQLNGYQGYDSDIKPDINNIFSTAAYRIGHTMVTEEIPLIGNNCNPIDGGSIPLLDGFFNPGLLLQYDIDPILQGLASQTQQKVDAQIVDNLRNFLFPIPGSNQTFGLDLASLNIQRGRDHGLPSYLYVRAKYTGEIINSFADITSDETLQAQLAAAYGNIFDIDPWVGLLSEDPLPGSSVGLTMRAILSEQFEELRSGDYYYYENDPKLDGQDRNRIRDTRLGEIIERNSNIINMQNNVFFADECNNNPDNGGGGNGGNDGGPGGNGGGPGGNGGGPGGGNAPGHTSNDRLDDGNSNLNFASNQLVISPNPSNGKVQLNLQLDGRDQNLIIKVSTTNGKLLMRKTTQSFDQVLSYEMDLSNLTPGLYIISVQTNKDTYSERVMIDDL